VTQLSPFAVINNFYTIVNITFKAGVDQLSKKFITRRLNSAGIKSRIAAVKDFFMEEYRSGQLQFARHYVNMPIIFCRLVNLYCKNSLSSSAHGKIRVLRLNKQRYNRGKLQAAQQSPFCAECGLVASLH
jgi:hypothetical protein